MGQQMWQTVDDYLNRLLIPEDPILRRGAAENRRAGLPPQDVAPNQGKLLFIFARRVRARRIMDDARPLRPHYPAGETYATR